MGLFDKLESRLEQGVNGAFARAFKSEVQPVEIAASMRRAMDDQASSAKRGQRAIVPNLFTIELSPTDYDRLAAWGDELDDELIASAQEHSDEQRYVPAGPFTIVLHEDEELETGVFRLRPATAKASEATAARRAHPRRDPRPVNPSTDVAPAHGSAGTSQPSKPTARRLPDVGGRTLRPSGTNPTNPPSSGGHDDFGYTEAESASAAHQSTYNQSASRDNDAYDERDSDAYRDESQVYGRDDSSDFDDAYQRPRGRVSGHNDANAHEDFDSYSNHSHASDPQDFRYAGEDSASYRGHDAQPNHSQASSGHANRPTANKPQQGSRGLMSRMKDYLVGGYATDEDLARQEGVRSHQGDALDGSYREDFVEPAPENGQDAHRDSRAHAYEPDAYEHEAHEHGSYESGDYESDGYEPAYGSNSYEPHADEPEADRNAIHDDGRAGTRHHDFSDESPEDDFYARKPHRGNYSAQAERAEVHASAQHPDDEYSGYDDYAGVSASQAATPGHDERDEIGNDEARGSEVSDEDRYAGFDNNRHGRGRQASQSANDYEQQRGNFTNRESASGHSDEYAHEGHEFQGDATGHYVPEPEPTSRRPHVSPRQRPWLKIDGQRYPLLGAITVLGRDEGADIIIDDQGVSRSHCEIRVTHDGPHLVMSVRDLGSTNGTYVNGDRIDSEHVRDGDRLTIGRTPMTIHLGDRT